MPRPLVTGQFNHIAIAAYAAPRGLVEGLLPRESGLVADEPHPELGVPSDSAVVSVVGLSAEHMRLWGIRWPGRSRFGELALRVHVRQGDRRGVLHVRRYNSSGLWTWTGVRSFGEDCRRQAVVELVRQQPRTIRVEHKLTFVPPVVVPGPGQVARPEGVPGDFTLAIEASKPVVRPDTRGVEHWLKETRWVFTPALSGAGLGPARSGRAPERGPGGSGGSGGPGGGAPALGGVMVHEVLHPLWSIFPEPRLDVRVDFANLFGVDWGFLNGTLPVAACLALGSQVAVFARRPTVQVRWGQRRGLEPAEKLGTSEAGSIRPRGAAV